MITVETPFGSAHVDGRFDIPVFGMPSYVLEEQEHAGTVPSPPETPYLEASAVEILERRWTSARLPGVSVEF